MALDRTTDDEVMPVLEMHGVTKRFGETRVLLGVDLRLRPSSVLGVIGANGAGKTTLMRILVGETRADAGTFSIAGSAPIEAGRWSGVRAAGGRIAMVHQEIPVFDNLRVYEHFALERASRDGTWRWRAGAKREAAEVVDRLFPGSGIRPAARVADLSFGRRQMLDIALAMSSPGLEILVLDEPSSALDREQALQLRNAVQTARDDGVAVLVVSHRLEELLDLCDEVTVLRDGKVAAFGPAASFDEESLIVAMGGVALTAPATAPAATESAPATAPAATESAAAATGASGEIVATVRPPDRRGLTIEVRRGEIVGLAGLSGSGQSEVVTAMARNRRSRNISISGHASLVSGDRRRSGLFALWSILRNFTIGSLGSEGAFGVVFSRRERATFDEWKDRLQIVASDPDELITTLSGGNQQKVLIARALAAHPQILLLDDPTRGVDATTKLELYEMLRSSAANGMAVLWYSTEDDEMLQCDRAYVMREGVVEHELRGAELSREAIVTASFAPGGSHREVATAVEATEPRSRWAWALTPRGWFLIALVLAILVVATGFAAPDALSLSGLPTLTNSFTPLVLAAAAELMIISVADIDLGVGAYMGLVNAVSATWMISHPWLGGLALVGFLVLYVLQGLIVAVRKVPAIIVTLGFSFVWLGIALVILPTPGGTSPGWLTSVGAATWTFPEPLVIAIVVGTLTTLMFFRTHLGVRIRAVGNNADSYAIREHSTRHAIRERVVAWAFAGIFATLAGLSVTALTSSADPSASSSDTLLAIAAVIVGGGEFVGGIVEPAGAVLGALMFGLLQAYLALTSINVNYTSLVEGIVLVAVLGLRLIFRPQVAAALSRRSVPFARRRSGGDSGPSLPLEPESPGFGSGGDTGSISSSAVS